jgi:MoaA/NifB/PqqE/SkfB family radical SAM enzyme
MEISTETGDTRSATLMVHLLGRCNLTCKHCYMEGAPSRTERLPLDLVLGAIGECRSLGIANLYVTGGEPLLYPGFEQVLEKASEDPGLAITVCTNATLVKAKHVALLKEVNARVNVSVDGSSEFHDLFRGRSGAFKATERGLQKLVEAAVPVTIVSTISRANLHMLSDMVEWAARVGAVQFRAQPLLDLGRGRMISDQCLSNSEMNHLLLWLTDLANAYRLRGLKCNVVGASRAFLRKHPCGAYVCNGTGCHRRVAQEIKKVVIREDGTILPEITNLSHIFAIGTLFDGPLSTLVAQYFRDGYRRFDQLCRTTYAEVLPGWDSEFIPWDQIVAERSRTWRASATSTENILASCGTCSVIA